MASEWSLKHGYRRVTTPVTLPEAKERLIAWRDALDPKMRDRLWNASRLAEIIWPGVRFGSRQGAGRCAASILTKIGCQWRSRSLGHNVRDWGWDLGSLK
jgi:hypothetical protein